jgi:hypothetical protein
MSTPSICCAKPPTGVIGFINATSRDTTRVHSDERRDLTRQTEYCLKQSDSAIKPIQLSGGTIKLKDEVETEFEIFLK